jgi:hypothetical protein
MLRRPKRRTGLRSRFFAIEPLEDRRVMATGIGVFDATDRTFSLRNQASAGAADAGTFQFSADGTLPVVGDWNGDGQDEFGLFNPANATWSLRYGAEAGGANAGVFPFGQSGSIPVVGDWNGDGRDDIGTFKEGVWTLRFGASPGLANAGVFTFGAAGSTPVVGDWDGDGRDGIGIVTRQNGNWSLRQTAAADGAAIPSFRFGPNGGTPVVGDWNGDGRDGIGMFESAEARWNLRQTASAGAADAGVFVYGTAGTLPVTGDFTPPAAPENAIATVVLPPIDVDLLGLEVRTSPITVHVSTSQGDGKLLGNLLNTVSTLVDLDSASSALNTVLDSTVDLLNSASLNVTGAQQGSLDDAASSATQMLELFVAPVHLDLLGVQVDTSTIRVTITTKSGEGLILGNALTELMNLFNPPLPEDLDVDYLNDKLDQLLATLNQQLPNIAAAPTPAVPISDGQILNLTVPALDLNLLGLVLETSPITINASAEAGDGALLGNVLTTALKTLDATPQNLSELNTNINGILAKVVGVLNVADLNLLSSAVDSLPAALQTLVRPSLTAPAVGSTAPILDLMIASTDGTSPPVNVDLLGLSITTSNIEAHLSAQTGEGQILGNLLYNVANLADPGGPAGLLNLLNLLGTNALEDPGEVADGSVTPNLEPAEELLTLTVKPLDIDLLGLELRTDPIVVTLSAQAGDGKLLGNLLSGITTLINVDGVSQALNNVLSTTVDILNSAGLSVDGVGSGSFDNATEIVTPILDLYVAPVHLDLLGLVAETEPIRLTLSARSGQGLVLGNVVAELANLFNPPLPDRLNIDDLNERLEQLISRLNQQIPGIPAAETPAVDLDPGQFLELTVPALDVDLLGLVLQTTPITLNASAESGNGLLLGNVLTTVLNTVDATPENLTGINENLNAVLAKVVGVLNAADLILPTDSLALLPVVLQTLALPDLLSNEEVATTQIVDLVISSDNAGPPVDVDLLGLSLSTSNIDAQLLARTGDGQVLGNLLYNVANLLNSGNSSTLLSLLAQLGRLPSAALPTLNLGPAVAYTENAAAPLLSGTASLVNFVVGTFNTGSLTVSIAGNASANDRLVIRSQGIAQGQISVSGANVLYGGKVIGTFTGGVGSTPLSILFNENASPIAVQSLIRNITFNTLGDAPSTALRTIEFALQAKTGNVVKAGTSVTVTALNDAPVLDASLSPKLRSIAEDTRRPYGTPVAELLKGMTDVDANAKQGLAVTWVTGTAHGSWQFTLDNGATWQPLGNVTATAARLIPSNGVHTRVRFIPKANFNGDVQLGFFGWDQTMGSAGGHANVSHWRLRGGSTAFSNAWENATLAITAVNDAPVLGISGSTSYQKNSAAILLASTATVRDVDSANFAGGVLRLNIVSGKDDGNRLQIGGSFTRKGDEIRLGNTVVGRLNSNGGIGTTDLVLTLTEKANASNVQQLLRSITFRTEKTKSTEQRVINFTLSDGDGALSIPKIRRVNVAS